MKSKVEREKQLKTQLKYLLGRLHRIEDHLEQPPNPDWEENAIEAEMDEVLEGLGSAGMQEVKSIQAALGRIKEGTYGVCIKCETPISEERLNTLPETALCRNCAGATS